MTEEKDYKALYYQQFSEFGLLRQEISEIKTGQSKQNERLARIEEKLDSNASRCLDRGKWMGEVDSKIEGLTDRMNQAIGAKTVILGILGAIGATVIGLWEAYRK